MLTVTSDEPAVRVNFVNGRLAALCGARLFPGCVAAETVTPAVVGAGFGVGLGAGVTAAHLAISIAFALARELAPQYPVPAESPTGARTSEAYLFWNLITAAFVAGPK